MAVLVRIPTPLRTLTKGAAEVQADASTITDLIEVLERQFPGLKERLLEDGGQLRRFVNIYLNDEDIRYTGGVETALKPGDTLDVLPALAGG